VTYDAFARAALATLETRWFAGDRWRMCLAAGCPRAAGDWGADALTFDLALGRRLMPSAQVSRAYFDALAASAPTYGAPCRERACTRWSDVPAWDALAAMRDYDITASRGTLEKAKAAYAVVDRATVYARGACPEILYQQPFGGRNKLKTLETDSNLIRDALALARVTHQRAYLHSAVARYAAVRRHFLDPVVPLYTVYVFDDAVRCTPLPHRFFASVNGNMIAAGLALADATGDRRYAREAMLTARAVARDLSDARGIYADLQAENDIVEPLVEAMHDVALRGGGAFAGAWIVRNARAAASARAPDGSFGRFFDGPPPHTATAWQTSGGFALMIAAAALVPRGIPRMDAWQEAKAITRDISTPPATIAFTGSSIALLGTLGEQCCESGHARVFIDGHETFDRTGIWQNKSSSGLAIDDTVLFAWRWPRVGTHRIRFEPGSMNPKEGRAFLHVRTLVVR
jgi:hypothetical protein